MATSAKEAYPAFLGKLLAWLPNQAGVDDSLRALIAASAGIKGRKGYDHIAPFRLPEKPEVRIAFRQDRVADDRKSKQSKVFALEIDLWNGTTQESLESNARHFLPIGSREIRHNGEVYFIQIEWGRGRKEYDRLTHPQVHDILFRFALDALRFAAHALLDAD